MLGQLDQPALVILPSARMLLPSSGAQGEGAIEFPPGFTGETTRFLHELAKAAGIPPGLTDAAIAKYHGSAELCLELFG